jgi:hypothetical protein
MAYIDTLELTLLRKKYIFFFKSMLVCYWWILTYSDNVKLSAHKINGFHTNTTVLFYELYILG